MAALFFDSAKSRRELEERLARLVEGRGYAEAILPILDYLEPYEALLTPASRAELYRFLDRDGEQLALRADFTPMLARLLAPRLATLSLPLRLFYRGDVVRYEVRRPLAQGFRRELFQLGVERLGPADAAADPVEGAEREVLLLFLEALTAAGGAGAKQVVLGFSGCLDEALLEAVRTAPGGPAAAGTAPGQLAAAVARRDRGVVRGGPLRSVVETGLPERAGDLGPAAAARLEWLAAVREELAERFPGVELSIDLAEFARYSRHPALAGEAGPRSYYDGLVFHAYAGPAGVPAGGGGRYGSLFRALGADIEAIGFSLNLDALAAVER